MANEKITKETYKSNVGVLNTEGDQLTSEYRYQIGRVSSKVSVKGLR